MSGGPLKPSRRLERFHFSRALCWVLLGIYIFAFDPSLRQSVALVIILSLYANFGTDISSWQGARAERRSLENPPGGGR